MGHAGHTGMEKKNPFVMTIGFDKNDPDHVEVAEFLNSLPRKKAQYIVEAVRCYKRMQRENTDAGRSGSRDFAREAPFGNDGGTEPGRADRRLDQEQIRQVVLQVLAERTQGAGAFAERTKEAGAFAERTRDAKGFAVQSEGGEGFTEQAENGKNFTKRETSAADPDVEITLDQEDLNVILGSLEALRN